MRVKPGYFVIAALFASLASGQPPAEEALDRQFQFAHAQTTQDLQEIATVIRNITNSQPPSVDTAQRTLAMRGTAGQMALAEWLFHELDKPLNRRPDEAAHVYRLSVSPEGDDVVRVFYLANTPTIQQFQELVTQVRSIADIRRLYTYNAPKAVVVRGTAEQIGLAEWLFNQLDKPVNLQAPGQPGEYRLLSGGDDVVRVFYLTHTPTVQEFQEVCTLIRSITDIRRVFTYNAPRAVALRATATQMAFAEWMVGEMDKAAQGDDSSKHEYRLAGGGDNVARIFYLPNAATVQRFQEIVTNVRSTTGSRRVFTYNAPRAVALRGTADQIALADRLFNERDR
jgi:hypothetical protein